MPSNESDIYAYGGVCYEVRVRFKPKTRSSSYSHKIFAGCVPFPDLSDVAVLYAVLLENKHPTRPEGHPELPDPMWDMMVTCWDVDPSSRPTMEDVLALICETNLARSRNPGAALEWTDPTYTQIWSDVEHPTLSQDDVPHVSSASPSPPSAEYITTIEMEDKPWLGSDLGPGEILLNDYGEIKGGTIKALVERLTWHNPPGMCLTILR